MSSQETIQPPKAESRSRCFTCHELIGGEKAVGTYHKASKGWLWQHIKCLPGTWVVNDSPNTQIVIGDVITEMIPPPPSYHPKDGA